MTQDTPTGKKGKKGKTGKKSKSKNTNQSTTTTTHTEKSPTMHLTDDNPHNSNVPITERIHTVENKVDSVHNAIERIERSVQILMSDRISRHKKKLQKTSNQNTINQIPQNNTTVQSKHLIFSFYTNTISTLNPPHRHNSHTGYSTTTHSRR